MSTGTETAPMPTAVAMPITPMVTNCASPSSPIPRILPASSCQGRSVASSSSTTRLDFSSTTPSATHSP